MHLLFAGLLLVITATASAEQDSAVFIRHRSTVFSESVPFKAFDNDLRGSSAPSGGKHALTFNRLELGIAHRGFELARFIREDYVFNFSPDTMEILYRDKNRIPIPEGKIYDVYLKAQHIKAEGWRAGYGFRLLGTSHVRLSLNYIDAEELLHGSLAGQITVDDGDINGGDLEVLYHYEEDYLLGRRRINPATGTGYSVDLESKIELKRGWTIALNFYDLLGQIYWDTAPYTRATIASTNTYYDGEGYAHREPTMIATESYKNFTQNLPIQYQLSVMKQLYGAIGVLYTREKYDQVDFDRLFLNYQLSDSFSLLTGYDFTMEAFWIALHGDALSLDIATDDWSLIDSRALVLRLAGRLTF